MDLADIPKLITEWKDATDNGDFSGLIKALREGHKGIIESEGIRELLADKLEGIYTRRKGATKKNNEYRDRLIMSSVAYYIAFGLHAYSNEGKKQSACSLTAKESPLTTAGIIGIWKKRKKFIAKGICRRSFLIGETQKFRSIYLLNRPKTSSKEEIDQIFDQFYEGTMEVPPHISSEARKFAQDLFPI